MWDDSGTIHRGGGAEKTQRDETTCTLHASSLCAAPSIQLPEQQFQSEKSVPFTHVIAKMVRSCAGGVSTITHSSSLIRDSHKLSNHRDAPNHSRHVAVSLVTICVRLLLLGHQHPSVEVASPSYQVIFVLKKSLNMKVSSSDGRFLGRIC